jgi:uncharacterized protein (TIGR03790 family)
MNRLRTVLVALACGLAGIALGANPGDEVIVLYNARVPESKALAEYYAQRRLVPTNQVFGFELSTGEEMSRAEFRDVLQQPLAKALAARGLWKMTSREVPSTNDQPRRVEWRPEQSRIRYAVLCYGMPLKILKDPNLKETEAEKVRPELRRNEAAVDSELALLPTIDDRLPAVGPLRNPIYTTTNAAHLHPSRGVLMVSRLDGLTPEIARGLVDKAMEAETNGLWGRVYVDVRNLTDPNYKTGEDWIRNAGEVCRFLGFETVVDNNPGTFPAGFPMSHIAFYFGWYDENASGPFARETMEFMPGAFGYHLHSFSAVTLRSATRGWAGPMLAKGVTATMGCVDEPYLGGTPDLAVFTSRLVFSGFSLGEAAYACQPVLSWQTTVVGDPLYRPFGGHPEQIKHSLQERGSQLLEWYYLRLLNVNLVAGKTPAEAANVLDTFDRTKESAVLLEKQGDLYTALGKPQSAIHSYSQALKLNPSPQQRLRLRLTLGDRLTAQEQFAEATEQYRKLLEEDPNYPDRAGIQQKLDALAQKPGKQ